MDTRIGLLHGIVRYKREIQLRGGRVWAPTLEGAQAAVRFPGFLSARKAATHTEFASD